MICANSFAFLSKVSCKVLKFGMRCWVICRTAAMCMMVGKESLEDCDIFTWSFGWTGFFEPSSPPSRLIARLDMTSLTFMWNCVPEPVCQTTRGKWSFNLPSATSFAAAWIASDILGSRPYFFKSKPGKEGCYLCIDDCGGLLEDPACSNQRFWHSIPSNPPIPEKDTSLILVRRSWSFVDFVESVLHNTCWLAHSILQMYLSQHGIPCLIIVTYSP